MTSVDVGTTRQQTRRTDGAGRLIGAQGRKASRGQPDAGGGAVKAFQRAVAIGTDLAGNPTTKIRIVTDENGTVITSYPIP